MKKRYSRIIVCVTIIAALFGGIASYFVKENEKDSSYDRELPADIPEKTRAGETVEIDSSENTSIYEETETAKKIEMGSIRTVISPNEMACMIALDDEGHVWKWEEGKTKEDAVLIEELENVEKILDTGSHSVYVLTEKGDVYAWGFNRGWLIDPDSEDKDANEMFPEPVKLNHLSNITKIDAANGKAFAVDREGQLFVWGLGRYKYITPDYIPSLLEGYEERTNNVEEIYVGTGNFHYFKRKDNQIFSILLSENLSDDLCYFIVPNFMGEPAVSDWRSNILAGESERIFDVRVEEGPQLVYLYEMGKKEDVALISSDGYTMYLYQEDGTLWYWDSDIITYHDKEWAGASVERRDLDYSGFFEEVDVGEILDMETDDLPVPKISSISPGVDGALFLLENGEVFVSEYVTTEIKDVEYFERSHGNPQNTWTTVAKDLPLKGLSFRKLDYENIISISSNKDNTFYLVDKDGNIYCYQSEEE